MCFQSQSFGSLHTLLPNSPENNPTVFFPRIAGNDLTTARKRNVKHSLELFVTSERWGGPCASASLDIPEHTQPKLPTAGVNCCLTPTPKQSKKNTSLPPPTLSALCVTDCSSHLGLCCLPLWADNNAFSYLKPDITVFVWDLNQIQINHVFAC